jgi:uncharacterized protein YdbL (DUF1318 family)
MSQKNRFSDRLTILACVTALAGLLLGTQPTAAQQEKPLDAPRAAGVVGERYDGYAVLRDANAPQAVKDLIVRVNERRKAFYAKRAAEDKVPEAAVGRIYAQQIVKRAPAGTYFLDESGKWTRR